MFERFGNSLEASIVLTATAEGMPLLYRGQEAGLDKVLANPKCTHIHLSQLLLNCKKIKNNI